MTGWLMLVLAAVGAEPERLVVPLEPASWSNSTPAALRGGRAPAALAEDDGQPALHAPFGFGDPKLSEPLFISTKLPAPPLRRAVRQIRFRYRFDAPGPTAPLLTPGGFRVRLRTGPTSFTDHDVPLVEGGWPTGRWVEAVLEADLFAGRITNIYSRLFEDQHVQELTFRLDDVDHQNAAGTLHLADLSLVVEADGSEQPYTPVTSPRPAAARLRLLNIVHGADGWYDFDLAARRLDPAAEVLSSPFRGLHFPIWDFPASRAELLSYDLIVLGDVDPWVLTDTQVRWLVDAVHSGAGLLVGGGHHSLGLAKKHPRALLDLLPVTYQPGAPVV
ncbi:MAG: hypothetical protein HUU35_11325, partial [Armatimonadetes bacterium]|nr:hypothetical protein [Armatimonadota bacterium]